MQINKILTYHEAEELYEKECVLVGSGAYQGSPSSGVPVHRIGELFGNGALEWFVADTNKVFKPGKAYGLVGGGHEDFFLNVVYLEGFLQFVGANNRRITHEAHLNSDAGRYYDCMEAERCAELAARNAEEERKREERKAKRAAARKAKQEAAEQAVNA